MSEKHFINRTSPIPEIFHSDKSKQLFTHCKMCEKDLMACGEPYLIEKAYGQDLTKGKREVIFELAYCMKCLQGVHDTLSEESRQRIQTYFNANTELDKRDEELNKYELFEVDVWLQNCIIKNKSIDEVKEFQIYALCVGSQILYHQAPYMVCGEAVDEIGELLSNKSLDILNDFMTDIIDVPPEFNELFKTKTPIIF